MIEPIRRTTTVRCDLERAFRVFTTEIGTWWPVHTHSMAVDREDGSKTESLVLEERVGGRVYEVMSDGTEGTWATILVWEPPHRLVVAWKPKTTDEPPTEVEVTFTSVEGGGTRVELEHRGWERLGPGLAAAKRQGYAGGWIPVLERYEQAANG